MASAGPRLPSARRERSMNSGSMPVNKRVAALIEPRRLCLECNPGAIRIRFAVDHAVAYQPRIPRHPGNHRERREIADRHVVRAFGTHAETPDRESGKTRPIGEHHVQMLDRNRLGLRRTVDVDELRQHVADCVDPGKISAPLPDSCWILLVIVSRRVPGMRPWHDRFRSRHVRI